MSEKIPFLGFGLGLRAAHIPHVLEKKPSVDWFEIISENYMDATGQARENLERVLEIYPVVMHGVSLSIGTVDPLNSGYLNSLKNLASWVKPAWVSDHLCWTGVAHRNTHDLLPVPYTEEALSHIVDRIKRVQDFLGRPLVLENPSTYLEFKSSEIPEEEFISRMVEKSGCGLLLDANNIYVTCFNHRKDPKTYIDSLPFDRVYQMHLAGHTNKGTHIVDTHDGPVIDEVWALYKYIIHRAGKKNTMIEWDDKIPPFDVVYDELTKARFAADRARDHGPLPDTLRDIPRYIPNAKTPLENEQRRMQSVILSGDVVSSAAEDWIMPKPGLTPPQQLSIYTDGYRARLFDVVAQDFPALRNYLGHQKMNDAVSRYVDATPSAHFDAGLYPQAFPDFVAEFYASDTFAASLARLEGAIARLSYAPDSAALAPEEISALGPEGMMLVCLVPRTALEILSLPQDAQSYYSDYIEGKRDIPANQTPVQVAVYRHDGRNWRLTLDDIESKVLKKIFSGMAIGPVLEWMQAETGMTDESVERWISHYFARWMSNGILASHKPQLHHRSAA
jgi:hypothetical protein